MTRALVFVGLVIVLLIQASPSPRVAFLHPTRIANSQDDITWLVRVEPNAENRWLIVAAGDTADVVRSSTEQLDGAAAPRHRYISWRPLPAGEYLISALVFDGRQKQVARAAVNLLVVGP